MVSFLRALGGCIRKDLLSAWTEKSTILQTITLPINYLILLSLFALAGSNAPTAVVLLDHGPYAQAFVRSMGQAHSFNLMIETADQASQEYRAGTLVGVVTIPADFDTAVSQGQAIQIPFQVNNLNQDLTDDETRGMRLAITTFYAQAFPQTVSIAVAETDAYAQDTGYIPFLAISILVVALLVVGLLQAGMSSAREWEKATVKELLLAPASLWAILLGKILSVFLIGLPSLAVVLAVVIFAGDWPANFPLVVGVGLLSLLVFSGAGCALGMALKDRANITTISRAIAVPTLFLSGLFGPISYSTGAVQVLARIFPIHYAVVLQQFAFKNFLTNALSPMENTLILGSYALIFVVLAYLAARVSRLPH